MKSKSGQPVDPDRAVDSAVPQERVLFRRRRTQCALSALSGVVLSLVYPKFSYSELAWVALVPLLLVLRDTHGRRTVAATYVFGFCWYYPNLWWWNTLTIFNVFVPVGGILGPLYLSTILLLFTLPASYVIRRSSAWLSPFLVSFIWVGFEYLHVFGDFAFPWNLIGLSQHKAYLLPLIQIADVTGVFGVSFLVVLVNAAVAQATWSVVVQKRAGAQRESCPTIVPALCPLLLALLLVGAAWLHGTTTMSEWRSSNDDARRGRTRSLKLAVIQPNVSQLLKWETYAPETSDSRRMEIEFMIIRRLFSMVKAVSSEKPALYILPETAFTDPFFVYADILHQQLCALADSVDGDILFGADNRVPADEYLADRRSRGYGASGTSHSLPMLSLKTDDQGETVPYEAHKMAVFNSVWLVKPRTGLSGYVYNKIQLVPFGETAPVIDMIPFIQEKVLMVGSFQKGYEYTIFETSGTRYGTMVCFESAFAWLARALARKGAQMLCVLTNDAWYDPSYLVDTGGFWGTLFRFPVLRTFATSGPEQHLIHSLFRAVETRLPLVRVANTGISCVILPDGSTSRLLSWRQQGSFVQEVLVADHPPTLYVRWGDWFAQLCLAVTLIVSALQYLAYRRRPRVGAPAEKDQAPAAGDTRET